MKTDVFPHQDFNNWLLHYLENNNKVVYCRCKNSLGKTLIWQLGHLCCYKLKELQNIKYVYKKMNET